MRGRIRTRLRFAFAAILATGILAGAVVTRFGTRWPAIYYMTGPSMAPTVEAGEYFFVWTPADDAQRGDLVIFRFEDGDTVFHVLRRLAALPGDTVAMEEGAVVLNHVRRPWGYSIPDPTPRHSPLALTEDLLTWGAWIVPADSVVLLSDRRDMAGWPDSRFLGFIPRDALLGHATRTVTGRRLR